MCENIEKNRKRMTEIEYFVVCTQIAPVSSKLWKQPSKRYRRVARAYTTTARPEKHLNYARVQTWTVQTVRTINEEMWMRLATTAEAAASGRRNKCPKWITIKNDTIKMKNGSARKRKRESESRLKRSIAERKGIKTEIMYAWKGAWDFAWARRTYAQTHTVRTVFIESAFVVGVTVPVHMGWKVLSLSHSFPDHPAAHKIHNRIQDSRAHGKQRYACACRAQTNSNQRIQSREKIEMKTLGGD